MKTTQNRLDGDEKSFPPLDGPDETGKKEPSLSDIFEALDYDLERITALYIKKEP